MAMTTAAPPISGRVLTPESADYDEARSLFNAMIDKRPAVIAQCTSASDVVTCVRHARERGMDIAVRGGGHSVAGTSTVDDGMVIDLREMRWTEVDPQARTVRVGGGATMSDLDRGLQVHGLATTGGRISTTGVGGFTLGGGTGWLDRKFGYACDNLLSVELVTAEGEQVLASPEENPELFWALHGGGGNFGIATALTFRAYELPVMSAGILLWRPEDAPDVLRVYRDLMDQAADETSGGAIFVTGPPEEFVPEELVGELVLLVLVTHCGTEEELRTVCEPLLATGPVVQVLQEMPYADLQCMIDDPPGQRNYWSAEHLSGFPDAAVDAFTGAVDGMLVPSASQHIVFPGGGAAARADLDHPLPWRTAPWTTHPFAVWEDAADDEQCIAWTREVRQAMRPWATGDVYLNFIGDEGGDRIRAGYGAANWERLVAVKRQWDPDNVFHHNQNIPPDGVLATGAVPPQAGPSE